MATEPHSDEYWMSRCFDLAARGIGHVSPNPPVGAVLVLQGNILAEGYHHFRWPACEVDVIENVPGITSPIRDSTLFHWNLAAHSAPPCTELILTSGIRMCDQHS
jgi:diaminohydroxyphosphoribosylaminopyrimidine deaminase/5-amino-6-(5-phosphoribosylamino)uracil reductase